MARKSLLLVFVYFINRLTLQRVTRLVMLRVSWFPDYEDRTRPGAG